MAKDDDLKERIAKVEESTKSAHKRIDSYEENLKTIQNIAINVESLAGDVKVFAERLVNVKEKVDKIECYQEDEQKKPGKMVDSVKTAIIICVCTVIINAVMILILK